MGDYNMACGISNISMGGGQEIAYIPLEVNRFPHAIGDGNNNLIYKHCFYSPVTLPVFGVYDSYGGIENIERDANTELIETFFKCPVKDVMNIDKTTKPVSSGMFMHREIYEHLRYNQIDDNGKRKGFRIPLREEIETKFDKYRDNLLKIVKENEETKATFEGFLAKRENKEDEEAIKLIEIIENCVKNTKKPWDWALNTSLFSFRDYQTFPDIYSPQIMEGNFKKELIDFVLFEHSMYATNHFYFPTMNGWQYGNDYASMSLYKKCFIVMLKNILQQRYHKLTWNMSYNIRKILKELKLRSN